MNKALEIQNLTYKKNQKVILDNINLDLAQGKIVALLGENGAGKTTLMRCIAGVAKNWSGSIKVAGKSGEAEKKAKLAFSGIDPMARKKIINSIILWKDDNATILISDHFVNEIATLLDEVIILKDNRILTHQSADQIRSENTSIESFYQAFYEGEE